jgi:hypothetical protein
VFFVFVVVVFLGDTLSSNNHISEFSKVFTLQTNQTSLAEFSDISLRLTEKSGDDESGKL